MSASIKLEFDRFIKFHLALPLLLFLIVFLSLELTTLDLWMSRHFYNAELHQWVYKDNLLAETVLHVGGRYLVYVSAALILGCVLVSFRPTSGFHRYRRELIFLLLASISGPIIIAFLKNNTHIYCPWNLALFGGDKPYLRLFDAVGDNLQIGHCFPAAHSGSGFAFVSLYFFLFRVKPEYKGYGLCFGLFLGGVYGVAQQVRGAHFLSHDVAALAVCWFSAWALFVLFFRKQLKWL